ncbi:MAG: damage-control phosphatase ARMT1 family protein [Moorellaceae bacterium]
MKIHPPCISCILDTALRTVELVAQDRWPEYVAPLADLLRTSFSPTLTPGMLATKIQYDLYDALGEKDPYRAIRKASNNLAELILAEIIQTNPPASLEQVSLLAAAGNAIDFALETNVEESMVKVRQAVEQGFVEPHSEEFEAALRGANEVLFLLDNAGEIVFDRCLAAWMKEHYGVRISVVVNATPILNDAIPEDLETTGFSNLIEEIILLNPGALGFPTGPLPLNLERKLDSVDVVVCKGMANFEALDECKVNPPVVYILRAKCRPIASRFGVPLGSNVLVVRRQAAS